MNTLAAVLLLDNVLAGMLQTAAVWHDVGKAHGEFQAMLIGDDASRKGTLWAKSASKNGKCRRPLRPRPLCAAPWQ